MRSLITLAFAPLLLCHCGRPASAEECQEIVTRITELELKASYDASPSDVAREVSTVREALSDRIGKECVGQRITDAAMQCFRAAETSKDAAECFQ